MNVSRFLSFLRCVKVAILSIALAMPAHAMGPAAAGEDPVAEAKQLYEDGRARFETLDYEGAIELWTEAYATLPATADNRETRSVLAYNIATAQQKAFEQDGDVAHLHQAKGLLQRYLEEHRSLHGQTPEATEEREQIKKQMAEIEQQLAEARGEPVSDTSATAAPAPASGPAPDDDKRAREARAKQLLRDDPELSQQYRQGKTFIITGATLLGVGVLLLGTVALPYSAQAALTQSDRDAAIAGVSGLVAVGLIVPGAVLLPIGVRRFKGAKQEAQQRATVAPSVSRDGFGIRASFRF